MCGKLWHAIEFDHPHSASVNYTEHAAELRRRPLRNPPRPPLPLGAAGGPATKLCEHCARDSGIGIRGRPVGMKRMIKLARYARETSRSLSRMLCSGLDPRSAQARPWPTPSHARVHALVTCACHGPGLMWNFHHQRYR